jgi:2-polyprenyl-3-methyl-5-hydroxy-6-metoxy-1,4-benzoquinol methylase
MKEIFDDYIANTFGDNIQADFKFTLFEYNYRRHFPVDSSAKVLDIGIGRGEMLTCMKKWGYQNYLGIDISKSTIDFCSSLGLNCQLVDDTRSFLLEQTDQFSVITLIDVLEHINKVDIVSFLQSIYAALKKDGVLIIQVPNLQSPDSQLHRYNDITHEIGFVEHSLSQVLLAAGFNNIHFVGYEDLIVKTPLDLVRKLFRLMHWSFVRRLRSIDGNLNPKILHPVFCSIVHKTIS